MNESPNFYQFMFCVREAKKRTQRKGSSFDLTDDDVRSLWKRCGGSCELTGIAFDFEQMEARFMRRPYAPSLDRIDNKFGYTLDNIRVVCVAVNIAMNQWGEAVLFRVANALLTKKLISGVQPKGDFPEQLPMNVVARRSTRGFRYRTRVRDFGLEIHLGTFASVTEAVEAQLGWARSNSSLKVLREVYSFTRSVELLNEINTLRVA